MQGFVVVLTALLICREAAAFTNGDIYLYSPNEDNNNNVGVVQIYSDGTKKYICYSDSFNKEAANAACRQLGFEEAAKFGPAGEGDYSDYKPENGTQPGFTDVSCSGYQQHILRCSYEQTNEQCTAAVVVECENTTITENPYDGQVRLVSDDDIIKSDGKLEVYLNNNWRAVCSEGFTDTEADSVCRQLGYTNATGFPSVPRGSLMAWLLNSTCENSQECFTSCFEYPKDNNSEPCSEIVSVACTFDTANSDLSSGGTFCVYYSLPVAGIVLGVVFGSLALVLVIAIIVVVVCMLVPSCFLRKKMKRSGYKGV